MKEKLIVPRTFFYLSCDARKFVFKERQFQGNKRIFANSELSALVNSICNSTAFRLHTD